MSLPKGTWRFDGNGFTGDLSIAADASGNVKGSLNMKEGTSAVQGFWDEGSQRITFQRVINASDPTTIQTYTGYMFKDPYHLANVSGDLIYTLAGQFECFKGTGATPQRPVYGWYAQIGVLA